MAAQYEYLAGDRLVGDGCQNCFRSRLERRIRGEPESTLSVDGRTVVDASGPFLVPYAPAWGCLPPLDSLAALTKLSQPAAACSDRKRLMVITYFEEPDNGIFSYRRNWRRRHRARSD